MPTTIDILWLAVFPALVAVVAMLATRPWRRGKDLAGVGATLAIVAGFGLAVHHHWSVPAFPPGAAQGWLFYLAAAALVVAVVQVFVKSDAVGAILSCLVLVVTPFLLLMGQRATMPSGPFWMWVIGAGLGMALWWLAMEPLARRSKGPALPLILALVAVASGVAIMAANTQTPGRTVAALAVPLVVIALAGWWSRGRALARGGMLAYALLLLGMLLFAQFFASDVVPYVVLLVIAPLGIWAGEIRGLGERDSWPRVAVRWLVVIVILALPLFVSVRGLQKLLKEQEESYQYL